ncbi:MAG: RIP metalloprotease RseP [Halothermotrichaceae bacterium]
MLTLISFILVLGILIFIHEFGHYITAKAVGIRVEEFALGFGPRLLSYKKGKTVYSIRGIPLGGFCKMTGEVPPDENMSEKEKEIYEEAREMGECFDQKSPWKRFAVIFNGPLMNFILAVLFFSLLFIGFGIPEKAVNSNIIGDINPGLPAAEAGLKIGDKIVRINDIQIKNWEDIDSVISNSGNKLRIEVIRNGERKIFDITPKYIEQFDKFVIGIEGQTVRRYVGLVEGLKLGFLQTWQTIKLLITGIIGMVTGQVSGDDIAGPVMIASLVGQAAEIGLKSVMELTALLSINLGLLNLFPVPALDGGHILFIFVELIRGKPLNSDKQNLINLIGLAVLLLFMGFVIFKDLGRILF